MRMQQVHHHVGETGHDGVEDVENWRHKDKGELNRLGDPGQEAGQRGGEQNTGGDFFILSVRFVVHRQTGRWQREQHQRELALHEFTGVLVGIAAEGFHPFFQHFEPDSLVAVNNLTGVGGVVAEGVPERRIPDVVQAERNQRTFNQPEDKGRGCLIISVDNHRQRINTRLNVLPDVWQDQTEYERQQRGGNRHEAFTGEEAEEFRQLHFVEAVKAPRCQDAANQAAKDAHLQGRNTHHHGVFPALCRHFRRNAQYGTDSDVGNKHGDGGGQRRDAGFGGQADGRADGKQHWQVVEDNPTGVHHQRQMEFIPERQQQTRRGQKRDRQHQRAANHRQFGKRFNNTLNQTHTDFPR